MADSNAGKFSWEWPLAVGWEIHAAVIYTNYKDYVYEKKDWLEVLRDPEDYGPCLVCGEDTDWHLLHTQQRVCGMGCIERVRRGAREQAERSAQRLMDAPTAVEKSIAELRRLAKIPEGRALAQGKPRVGKGCRACNQK